MRARRFAEEEEVEEFETDGVALEVEARQKQVMRSAFGLDWMNGIWYKW